MVEGKSVQIKDHIAEGEEWVCKSFTSLFEVAT